MSTTSLKLICKFIKSFKTKFKLFLFRDAVIAEFIHPATDDFWEDLRKYSISTPQPEKDEIMAMIQRFQLARISQQWQSDFNRSGIDNFLENTQKYRNIKFCDLKKSSCVDLYDTFEQKW